MRLKQLNYLIAIIQSGSLSKASAQLGIAQPALSRQIRQLEQEVGMPLFYRHGRGISPTEKGAQFAATIEPLLDGLAQAKSELGASVGVLSGQITLGLPPSLCAGVGAALIRDFTKRFPKVQLHVLEGMSGFVNEWLVNGRVDMAVLNSARRAPSIRMDPLLTVDLFVIGRRDQMRALGGAADGMPTRALKGAPLILPGRHHGMRREIDSAAQRLGFELNTIVETDSLFALNKLARDGLGLTVLPQSSIMAENRDPEMSIQRLVNPTVTQSFMIAFSLNRPISAAMRELTRAIRAQVALAISEGRMTGRMAAKASPPESETPPAPAAATATPTAPARSASRRA